jgi:glycine cleavage system H protein
MSDEIPADLRYTDDHEWARRDGSAIVVGITAHAVEQLGDITLVTLPEVGREVTRGQAFGDIDSVKAVSELFAPVSGKIVEVNATLEDAPESVNEDPYGKGWLVKIEPSDVGELDELMDAAAYRELTADR